MTGLFRQFGIRSLGLGALVVVILSLASSRAEARDDANRVGFIGGAMWMTADANGDGLPETIVVNGGLPTSLTPGSQVVVSLVPLITVCIGTSGADSIREPQGSGHFLIFGGMGDDVLEGSAQDDDIYGGGGDDFIEGNAGDDRLLGGSGDDDAYGDDGNDSVYGEEGDDDLYGGDDNDVIHGGDGHDDLDGGDGDDDISGGAGHDDFDGTDPGEDQYDGGPGEDLFLGTDGETDDTYDYGSDAQGNDDQDPDVGDADTDNEGGSDTVIPGAGDQTYYI